MVESATTDDATLVAQAASGSEHAFRTLYRAYVRPVYWLAHRLVGNASDAEDVTQETFLVAWRKLRGLELAGESLLAITRPTPRMTASRRR
jgi:RNA polymerase sigma-70 factor (ECF subfamily)